MSRTGGIFWAYLDDIISFRSSLKAHASHVPTCSADSRVDTHLTISPTKCQFVAVDLAYLDHHIGLGWVQVHQKKLMARTRNSSSDSWAWPDTTGRWCQITLTSLPLSDLLNKGSCIVWTLEAESAFLDLMSHLAAQPPARRLRTLPSCLSVDTSDLTVGATLFHWWMGCSTQSAFTATS